MLFLNMMLDDGPAWLSLSLRSGYGPVALPRDEAEANLMTDGDSAVLARTCTGGETPR